MNPNVFGVYTSKDRKQAAAYRKAQRQMVKYLPLFAACYVVLALLFAGASDYASLIK